MTLRVVLPALLLAACASEPADYAPVFAAAEPEEIDCMAPADPELPEPRPAPRAFLSSSPALQASLERVLPRLEHSAGLSLTLASSGGGVEVEFSDLPKGVLGWAGARRAQIDDAVDPFVLDTIVLHEVLHILGANHLGPFEGVMSRCVGAGTIGLTAADLERLCAAQPCTAFSPEQ